LDPGIRGSGQKPPTAHPLTPSFFSLRLPHKAYLSEDDHYRPRSFALPPLHMRFQFSSRLSPCCPPQLYHGQIAPCPLRGEVDVLLFFWDGGARCLPCISHASLAVNFVIFCCSPHRLPPFRMNSQPPRTFLSAMVRFLRTGVMYVIFLVLFRALSPDP